ncbi:Gfo/Idh/MocA family protein [Halovulum marinum]|uniref:Gfo/Idh/MocA family protein n=1 Tax=Halovulum marinum TaxID=2662447 RepID=UPI0012B40C2D|nr:Gfo/Idh/MocA family oxidoreductase [Halovulum marinum]
MSRIGIGIVGCGEAAQIIHIPALQQLRDRFEITALCDVSPRVLDGAARQVGNGAATYADHALLAADDAVDAVLVANPDVFHAETAIAALEAGKHVFLEKPMCMTLAEADALAAAERRSGRLVQVGYMRRYAPALVRAAELVAAARGRIRFARVQDILGRNAQFIDDTSAVIRDADLPQATRAAFAARQDAGFRAAIGTDSGDLRNSYTLLLGLSSHDISAMRELLGRPLRVLHATSRHQGRVITAVFDYGDFVCEFATGIDEIARFDAYMEVFAEDVVIRVDYETPYIRNLPARLRVTRPDTVHGVAETVSFPSRLDSFVIEWTAFHRKLTEGRTPKTSVADARADLEIFQEIIGHLRAQA